MKNRIVTFISFLFKPVLICEFNVHNQFNLLVLKERYILRVFSFINLSYFLLYCNFIITVYLAVLFLFTNLKYIL